MMHFMYFANELRDFDQISKVEGEKVPQREIDLGKNLIDKMSAVEFEPEKYHDEYRERFLAMIDRKAKGQEVTVQPPTPERRWLILWPALKQSLERTGPSPEKRATERIGTATKTARKRRKA